MAKIGTTLWFPCLLEKVYAEQNRTTCANMGWFKVACLGCSGDGGWKGGGGELEGGLGGVAQLTPTSRLPTHSSVASTRVGHQMDFLGSGAVFNSKQRLL